MKKFRNNETGEIFTLEEIKTLCNQFYYEAGHKTAKDYFDYMIEHDMITEIETNYITEKLNVIFGN